MLDFRKVGAYISSLRKQQDMTQTELADLLNVSHQAVSKWERGESLPDIGTLPRLSEFFHTSIDTLLAGGQTNENSPGGADELVTHLAENNPDAAVQLLNSGQVDWQTVTQLAPILKPSMMEQVVQKGNGIRIQHLVPLAPFLNKDMLSQLTEHIIDNEWGWDHLVALAPFLEQEALDHILTQAQDRKLDGDVLNELAPFLGQNTLNKLIERGIEGSMDWDQLLGLAPFLDRSAIDRLAFACVNGDLDDAVLQGIAPFISRETLGQLVDRAVVGQVNPDVLVSLAPFLGQENLQKLLQGVTTDIA